MMPLTKLLTAVLSLSLLTAPTFAQVAAPPAPATRPAAIKATPEQQAWIDKYNQSPTDQPVQKMTWRHVVQGTGQPNPDFGKPDAGFMKAHAEFLERSKQPAQLLFIGDSITQGWRGKDKGPNGEPTAAELFQQNYGDKYQAANFGIGGDKTEHVLWRIANGELDAFANRQPKVVVVMIGTNNQAHKTPEQIAAGTTAVVKAVHDKLPESKILLLSIFPRAPKPDDEPRKKVEAANDILKNLDGSMDGKVKYLELWNQFLTPDGTLTKEMMPDALHPKALGYQVWVNAMNPVLDDMMK